tara:strand:- start:3 stop:455 length:453 start_codon:yes stop_codon:yes gene_type:complete
VEIYVDGDACPVKGEIVRVAERHNTIVYIVSNTVMRLPDSPLVKRIIVDDGFDAADDWIANRARKADIVITSDIPLAHRCVQNEASVLSPTGHSFDAQNIGNALAMRDLKSVLREAGEIRDHNPSFSKKDRSNFLQQLELEIRKIKISEG